VVVEEKENTAAEQRPGPDRSQVARPVTHKQSLTSTEPRLAPNTSKFEGPKLRFQGTPSEWFQT